MKMSNGLFVATMLASAVAGAGPASAATTTYTSRAAFAATLGTSFTDTYSSTLGYGPEAELTVYTDAQMSAIVGQTSYTSTTFSNLNGVGFNVLGDTDGTYCAGCNGSFKLGFANTSYTANGGVFGAGFDVDYITNAATYAFVTFADGSFQNYLLPVQTATGPALAPYFFGLTSTSAITSIAMGGVDGTTNFNNVIIDNLTIGTAAVAAVPEPATWGMMVLGFGLIGAAARRRSVVKTTVRFA